MTFKIDLDDSLDLVIVANNWMGGTYSKIIDKKFIGICKTIFQLTYKTNYMKWKSVSNLPNHGTCPIPKVKYLRNVLIIVETKLFL